MKVKPDLKEDIISFATSKLAHKASFTFKGRTNDWLSTTLPYHEDGTRNLDLTYDGIYYPAPTQSLLKKWFRVKHNLLVEVNYRTFGCSSGNGYFYMVERKNKTKSMNNYLGKTIFEGFKTYEEALEVGLQVAAKIIINKNKTGKYIL
ncbi:MAG: hypothetical protein WC428_02525 [Candidatus Paceibacterota bacterium]|jgi:hypothetical protein